MRHVVRLFGGMSLCLLTILQSCRLDYGADVEAKQLNAGIADMAVRNARFKVVRDGTLLMSLTAAETLVFNSAGIREMKDVLFEQFDDDGSLLAKGRAGKAVQSVETENVDFSEGLEVLLAEEDATIYADSLAWDSTAKTLRGKPDEHVRVAKEDGSVIEGTGFFADLSTRSVELSGGVRGVIADEP